MNKLKHFVLISCFVLIFAIELTFAQEITGEDRCRNRYKEPSNHELVADDYFAKSIFDLDSVIVSKMNQYHIPGLAASIVKEGEIFWTGAYGFANIEDSIEVTDSTLFMLASVSKTVTGVALMQLWEKGLFNLDEDINNYLPFDVINLNYPDSIITFRMLLTHTSSINDNWDEMPYYVGDSPIPLGEYLENYLAPWGSYYHPINYNNFAPGTSWDYCNIAVALVGYLVEVLTGDFSTYTKDSIFTPLDMNETAWFLSELDTTHIARPYYYSGGNYHAYAHFGYSDYPAGQLRTSTLQLSNFLIAFMEGGEISGTRILDSNTVELMTTVQFPQIRTDQGLIWYNQVLGGRFMWGHTGGDMGVQTAMFFIPEENLGVICLSNSHTSNFWKIIVDALFDYVTSVELETIDEIPTGYILSQNYPNPFNPNTKINFSIPKQSSVLIKVFDILGNEVETLINEEKRTGTYEITWNAEKLPSGVYFYRLQAGNYVETKKLVLLK
jgi:CubicO group peptidase (beta-lactamase class C family)